MAIKLGIPRSLFYFKYYPLWKTFFEELGVEIITSGKTTKSILNAGMSVCVDQACLPIKLFHGHVLELKDKVDYLFIPRFTSISRGEYICPQFGGLPDMVKNSVKDLPPIIDAEINLRKNDRDYMKVILQIGRYFCHKDNQIKKAYKKALKNFYRYREQIKNGILPSEILEKRIPLAVVEPLKDRKQQSVINVAVIGHVYNIYDSFVNMNMLKKLQNMGVRVVTIDTLDEKIINRRAEELDKRMFWHFGNQAIGAVKHLNSDKNISGIIYITSFGCGRDSFAC